MKIENISIPVVGGEKVSGILCAPAKEAEDRPIGLIVAHGAANDMHETMIVKVCEGLARKKIVTLRFNFLYREKGKKSPDSQRRLEETWESIYEFFTTSVKHRFDRVIVAGKSMGGRVASQLVSSSKIKADGLILLGYPLHAHGKKDALRDAHLYDIKIPVLFIEGTRDTLCDLSLLQGVLNKLQTAWDLMTIEGGDHSFRIPKGMEITQEKVYESVLEKCGDWIAANFGREK